MFTFYHDTTILQVREQKKEETTGFAKIATQTVVIYVFRNKYGFSFAVREKRI
jgi:hypothetical protein